MGQSQARASVRRYNVRMATEARYRAGKMPGALTNPANTGPTVTPEDIAEFIDSIREDEIAAERTDCADYDPEYND
jgi:hypothetical protein